MTVVGKLLVFLNLVFSLVVGTFAVFDYTARTHWSEAYKKMEANSAVIQGTAAAYKADAENLSKEKASLNDAILAVAGKELALKGDGAKAAQKLLDAFAERKKAIDQLSGEVVDLQGRLAAEVKKVKAAGATTVAGVADNQLKNRDVEKLRETVRDKDARIIQAVKDMNTLRDQKTAAEIESLSLRDRNTSMLARLTELERDNARLKANALSSGSLARRPVRGSQGSGSNPPPENVEGLVSRADGNLVKISIGSDSGISKGNTLEVFRLGVTPKYLGRIRIVEVTPNEAVGQSVGRTAQMKKGDRVASSILPR